MNVPSDTGAPPEIEHPRTKLVLVLGLLSIPIPLLGPVAWWMGNQELRQRDDDDRGQLVLGRTIGMVMSILLLVVLGLLVTLAAVGQGWLLTGGQYRTLIKASLVTIQILIYSFALGIVLSLVVGVARLSDHRWIRGAALAFVEFARGISSIILIFIMAVAIPILLDVPQASKILLAAIALGINMGGYGAEIIRGAILSVPKGQVEASLSLNLTPTQRLRHVILPQAMTVILPPMGNLTIEILKGTALVSLVGVADIMQSANNIRQEQLFAQEGTKAVLFLNVLVLYFILAQIVNVLFKLWERRVEKSYEGGRTLTPDELPAHIRHATPGVTG
ncbi:amino acid ABC transporter permease [Haloechinothrix halophila]|uniref:amino acid ABC transporter permease n=1 Tax=Haloechinothrix halophila TaxID=1069073 RepID=UPI000413A6BE|nr:amino acid ABC transporter permease [Haloechinothrix halophila]